MQRSFLSLLNTSYFTVRFVTPPAFGTPLMSGISVHPHVLTLTRRRKKDKKTQTITYTLPRYFEVTSFLPALPPARSLCNTKNVRRWDSSVICAVVKPIPRPANCQQSQDKEPIATCATWEPNPQTKTRQ